MYFRSHVSGLIVDKKYTKKGKTFIRVYDGSDLKDVFVTSDFPFEPGDDVDFDCFVITDKAYVQHDDKGGV